MNKKWLDITTEMSVAVKELRAGTQNVMKEFSTLARAAWDFGSKGMVERLAFGYARQRLLLVQG